jgi:hypothetical protein
MKNRIGMCSKLEYCLTFGAMRIYLVRLGCRFPGWGESVYLKVFTDHFSASFYTLLGVYLVISFQKIKTIINKYH